MGKLKNRIIEIDDLVLSTDLEDIISECEHVSQAQELVCIELGLDGYDAEIAYKIVAEYWNDFWGEFL